MNRENLNMETDFYYKYNEKVIGNLQKIVFYMVSPILLFASFMAYRDGLYFNTVFQVLVCLLLLLTVLSKRLSNNFKAFSMFILLYSTGVFIWITQGYKSGAVATTLAIVLLSSIVLRFKQRYIFFYINLAVTSIMTVFMYTGLFDNLGIVVYKRSWFFVYVIINAYPLIFITINGFYSKGLRESSIIYRNLESELSSHKSSFKEQTIHLVLQTLFEKNKREMYHCNRVAIYASNIASLLEMDSKDVEEIHLAGIMHDVGKIAIPEAILNKSGPLTDNEYELVKEHPIIGFRMLNSIEGFKDIAKWALQHHERYDGKGYPRQIQGENIPLVSRILSIADAFDAMTNYRTYRKSISKVDAMKELKRYAGTQFDSKLVNLVSENPWVFNEDIKKAVSDVYV